MLRRSCVSVRTGSGRVSVRRVSGASAPSDFKPTFTRANGRSGSKEWRLYFYNSKDAGAKPISPWNDLSLTPLDIPEDARRKDVVNMVVEIPKGTNAKFEISKTIEGNPIVQDVKDGVLRVLKHSDLPWNYGALPQTYEAPDMRVHGVSAKGDEDPVDVVELGSAPRKVGDVVKVKVLGAFCLLDQGEADWKVITINLDDPLAESMHDIRDVELQMPGKLAEIREWYRVYKVAEGKKENTFAFDGECLDKNCAVEVIGHSHFSWLKHTAMQKDMIPRISI